MQNLQDIHDKIFFEIKSILETLSKINTKDEVLAKNDLFTELTDRIAFLRILEKNEDQFSQILKAENTEALSVHDNQIEVDAPEHLEFNESDFGDDIIEEEVLFTNELNDFDEETYTETIAIDSEKNFESTQESVDENHVEFTSGSSESEEVEIPLIIEQEEFDYAERVARKEKELEEMEDRRRKIVEFSKHEILEQDAIENAKNSTDSLHEHIEKKFKLSHIKGLKAGQNLFENDPLAHDKELEKSQADAGSLLKSNVKTDFMEAEKRKPEFRLDLNDKVAFTKGLFAGNEEELKETIAKLNSFDNLEDAKQYLSEVYYRKDWKKADEFAQRLWNLVESKF